uniref:Uncharacterized protein n=1 Tax=Anopheles christyi TaxID=43041 RepID=A0A182KIN7_9DIPT
MYAPARLMAYLLCASFYDCENMSYTFVLLYFSSILSSCSTLLLIKA